MSVFYNTMNHPVGLLFLVIAVGIAIGKIPFKGFTLGGSGVLIAGLIFGHFGFSLPTVLQTVGVVLFVYSVGLKAGPYILHSLRQGKASFVFIALMITLSAGLLALILKNVFGLSPQLIVGIYAGSMTSTPALAAGIEALKDSSVSVGYGVAYPVGILMVILSVQVLPAIMKIVLKDEDEDFKRKVNANPIIQKAFRIQNENITRDSIAETLELIPHQFRVVRIRRGGETITAHADENFQMGDLVLVVGKADELDKLRILLGEEVDVQEVPYSKQASSRWMIVTAKKFVGKKIVHLEISNMFGVILTRVKRGDIEIIPSADFVIEVGDEIRVSGSPADLQRFESLIKRDQEMIHQTDLFVFSAGLILGVLVSFIRIPITSNLSMGLGIAGGPLVVGLFFGYFGRFGAFSGRVPKAAMQMLGDLGLFFFLAVSGCAAGGAFVEVVLDQGVALLVSALVIAVAPIVIAAFVGRYIFKLNFLMLLGMICGGMTSTPALGVLSQNTGSDVPALGYTGIYPMAVLFTTLTAQVVAVV